MADPASSPKEGSTSQAVLWVLAARQGERLIGIASIAILARLLSPKDFGLVAMAGSVVAIVEVFSAFGFDWALVRMTNPTSQHYNTAWTLKLLFGFGIVIVLVLLAHPAAIIFKRPEVAVVVATLGLASILGALENIWMAEYRRNSRFQPEFKMRMGAKTAGFVVAIIIALIYRSYWALVAGVLASRVVGTILSYVLHERRPKIGLSHKSELLGFSIWLLIGNLTETIRSRFADMWLGRTRGTASVGFYSMAAELATLATTELAAPINRAVFAKYAQNKSDVPALREAYVRVSALIWMIGVPAAVGTGVCASQIIATLLGDQWVRSVAVLQILSIAGILSIICANTHYVYWALGRSRFVSLLAIGEAAGFIILTIIVGSIYGLLGVAWAQVIALAFSAAINLAVMFRTLHLGLKEFVARIYRILIASFLMGFTVWQAGRWLEVTTDFASLVALLILIALGVLIYVGMLYLFWLLAGRPKGVEHDSREMIAGQLVRISVLLFRR